MWDLDRSSPIPLYYQIKEQLGRWISANLQPGDRIPSENEICRMVGVSRPTVRQALSDMVHEGRLFKRRGSGVYVAAPKLENALLYVQSMAHDLAHRGVEYRTDVRHCHLTTANAAVAEDLDLPPGSSVLFIERLRYVLDEPHYISRCYLPLPPAADPARPPSPGNQALFAFIEEIYGWRPHRLRRYLEAVPAAPWDAAALGLRSGAPLHQMHTVAYTAGGKAMACVDDLFRGDKSRFVIDLHTPASDQQTNLAKQEDLR